jgi:hypothetical protein
MDADGFITSDDLIAIGTRICGDGRISREEFTAGAAQFFLSSDPAHPGTSILGQA